MKHFVIWISSFLPLCGLLLALSSGHGAPPDLPAREQRAPTNPVLSSEDLVTERGEAPIPGLVLTLDDILIRTVESDYVRFSLQLGSLARDEQGPYFKDLHGRYYDDPEGGAEASLRYDLKSPRLDADAATLLDEGGERRLVLPEGVVVRDADGRPLVETESRVDLDAKNRTARSTGPAILSYPERGLEIHGVGLEVELGEQDAREESLRLLRDIVLTLPWRNETLTLHAGGPMHGRRKKERINVTVQGGGEFDHALGHATFQTLDVALSEAREGTPDKESYEPERIEIAGDVLFEPTDPDSFGGIRQMRTPGIRWEGETLFLRGPIRGEAVRPFEPFGKGARRLRIEAGGGRGEAPIIGKKASLRSLELFGGVLIGDRDEGGSIRARTMTYRPGADADTLSASGDVAAKTVKGDFKAERLHARWTGREEYSLTLEGKKEARIPVDGLKLGGKQASGGILTLTSAGPIVVTGRGEQRNVHAERDVSAVLRAKGRRDVRLNAGHLALLQPREGAALVRARDKATFFDPNEGLRAAGDLIELDEAKEALTLVGRPARLTIAADDAAHAIEAGKIRYEETKRIFSVESNVSLESKSKERGSWTLTCDSANGVLNDKREIVLAEARGNVEAHGPKGEVLSGDRLTYDGIGGAISVWGRPARLRRGDDVMVAYERIDVRIEGEEIAVGHAESREGPGILELKPKPGQKSRGDEEIALWRAELNGAADMDGLVLHVPKGGTLKALKPDGTTAIRSTADQLEITFEAEGQKRLPKRLHAKGNVEVKGRGKKGDMRIRADELIYDWGSGRLIMKGNVRIEGEAYENIGTFEWAEVILTEDGVKIQRLSKFEIHEK